MQIHELNNYSGALGAGSFVVIDDGVDTGKLSTQVLLSGVKQEINELDTSLNARIDNIIAGGDAPSADEIVDARLGFNNVTYISLGDAIRAQATILHEAIENVAGTDYYINFSKGALIDDTPGNVINVNSPQDTGTAWRHIVVECSEGDLFTVSGVGGGIYRLWAFADNNYVNLACSDALITESLAQITAPPNARYLVINANGGGVLYSGNVLNKEIKAAEDRLDYINEYFPQDVDLNLPTRTDGGVTLTPSGNTIAVTGSQTGTCTYNLTDSAFYPLTLGKEYTLDFDNGGSGFKLQLLYKETSADPWTILYDTTNKLEGSRFSVPEGVYTTLFRIIANSGQAVIGKTITIKIVIPPSRFLSDNDGLWEGKQWDSFGTSFSDNTCPMPFELGGVTGKYPAYLVNMSGLEHINHALGGSRITDASTADRDTILQRIVAADISGSDLITIEGFVNDWANASPIGDITDQTDATLYGALNLAIQSITSRNPSATIIIITDSTGRDWTSPGGVVKNDTNLYSLKGGITQNDYNKAVLEYCQKTGLICINAGQTSEISQFHPQYLGDNLHHSDLGGWQYAQAIWDELKNIMPNVK